MIKKIIAFLFILVVGWAFFSWITQPAPAPEPPRVFKNEFMSFEIPEGYEVEYELLDGRRVSLVQGEERIGVIKSNVSKADEFLNLLIQAGGIEGGIYRGKYKSPCGVLYEAFQIDEIPNKPEFTFITYLFEKNGKVFMLEGDFEGNMFTDLDAFYRIIATIQ